MHIHSYEPKLDFSDVLMIPKTSSLDSRSDVDIFRTFKKKHSEGTLRVVPVIAANMDTTGTFAMAEALSHHGMMVALHKHYTVEEYVQHYKNSLANYMNSFYSMGIGDSDIDDLREFIEHDDPHLICIDVANGYTEKFKNAVRTVRQMCPKAFIMAGNVVTPEKTEEIIIAGADCVKVGIGPGAVCTTRIKTGVGYPQFSAIVECADAAHGVDGFVCGDGGCTSPGDIAKAFGAGADFVMLGSMFAGTDECDGEKIHIDADGSHLEPHWGSAHEDPLRPTHMRFYGMSSKTANDRYAGGLDNYRAAEGKEVLVPYKGPVVEVVQDILGGVRSAMTYVGARKLKELTKRATFVIVNNQHNKFFD